MIKFHRGTAIERETNLTAVKEQAHRRRSVGKSSFSVRRREIFVETDDRFSKRCGVRQFLGSVADPRGSPMGKISGKKRRRRKSIPGKYFRFFAGSAAAMAANEGARIDSEMGWEF